MLAQNTTQKIKAEALRLGFSACGIAKAESVDEATSKVFISWLNRGDCATMDYMRNNLDKRLDPTLLMPGAKSVISLALNYYPTTLLPQNQYQFAYYAYGKDYHDVMRRKMQELCDSLKTLLETPQGSESIGDEEIPLEEKKEALEMKICCDTVPILDRYWAWKSGIGWIGKNTNLIIPHAGSFFFLGEIIVNRTLAYDTPLPSQCGNCTRCLDACPTHALQAPHSLNANRCLSFLTIESRQGLNGEAVDPTLYSLNHPYIYGCDRCQQACPHNRFATPTLIEDFRPSAELLAMTKYDWHALSVEQYRPLFKGSAVKRAKYEGLKRNINLVRSSHSAHFSHNTH